MQGILNLDKPAGISSARAVAAIKRLVPTRPRVGHAGTLDPFATGVLLILIGKATRWCESLMDQPKVYRATFKLGATTPTDGPDSAEQPWTGQRATADATGVSPYPGSPAFGSEARARRGERGGQGFPCPSRQQLLDALPQFIGTIQQRPPPFSAIRIAGRRAYDLARRGELVDLPLRSVTVHAIDLESYAWPLLNLRIKCGRGFYVRSLARDLGAVLGVGGHVTALRRLAVGPFSVDTTASLDSLQGSDLDPSLLHQWPAAL